MKQLYKQRGKAHRQQKKPAAVHKGLWQKLQEPTEPVKTNFSAEILKNELLNYFHGKLDFSGPKPDRKVVMWISVPGKSKKAQVRQARNWQKRMLNSMKNAVG